MNKNSGRLAAGDAYGRWTVIQYSHKDRRNSYFHCQCECGRVSTVRRWSLLSGHSRSCGCLADEHRMEWAEEHSGRNYPRRATPRPKRVRVTP